MAQVFTDRREALAAVARLSGAKSPLRVLVVQGVSGTGKSTLLRHVLRNSGRGFRPVRLDVLDVVLAPFPVESDVVLHLVRSLAAQLAAAGPWWRRRRLRRQAEGIGAGHPASITMIASGRGQITGVSAVADGAAPAEQRREAWVQAMVRIAARVRRPVLLMVDTTELLYVFDDAAREDRARTAIGVGDWFVRDVVVRLLHSSPQLRVILAGQDQLAMTGLPDSAWQVLELAAWSEDDVVDHFAALGLGREQSRLAYTMSGGMPLIAAAIADVCRGGVDGEVAALDQAAGQPVPAWLADNILGRLSAEQRLLVEAACVLRVVTEPALAHLMGDTELSNGWFAALARHNLLQMAPATNRAPRLVMNGTIRRWLLEHVARADRDQVPGRRQLPRRHRAAAEFYAVLADGVLSAEEMYHRFSAGDTDRTRHRQWEQAVLAAVAGGRLGDALALAQTATIAAAEPAQASVPGTALALSSHAQAHIAVLQGHLDQAGRLAADADRHYRHATDPAGQAAIAWMRGELAWREDRYHDAATWWHRSLHTPDGIIDPTDRADLALALAEAVCRRGDLTAVEAAADVARLAAADATTPPAAPVQQATETHADRLPLIPLSTAAAAQILPVTLLRLQATGALGTGDQARADTLITQGIHLARTLGEPARHEHALLQVLHANAALLRNDLETAEAAVEQGLQVARSCPDARCRVQLLLEQSSLALTRARSGPALPAQPDLAPAAFRISLTAAAEAAHQRTLSGRYAQAALDLALDLTDRTGQADALNRLGNLAQDSGDLNTAEQHHKHALALYRQTGNLLGQATALDNVGDLARDRGELDTAKQYLEQALALYEQTGNRLSQANALDQLGHVARDSGDLNTAEQHHKHALALYQQTGHRSGQANAIGNLGIAAQGHGELDTAEQYLEQALTIFRQTGNLLSQAISLDQLGKVARDRGDLNTAERHHQQALALYHQTGHRPGQAHSLDNLGHVADDRGELTTAKQYFEQALTLNRQTGNRHGQAHALNNLGHVARARGDLNTAEQCLDEALALYQQTSNRPGQAHALNNLGYVTQDRGDLNTAEQHFEQALALYHQTGSPIGRATAMDGLGHVARQRGELNTAKQHHEQALALYHQTGSRVGQAIALKNLGHVARDGGDLNSAKQHYEQALALYQEIGSPLGREQVLRFISRLGGPDSPPSP
ncbi:tetratricopeptide repeat protein [Streptomyces sp. NPDC002004]